MTTTYAGINFWTRLEARYAIFFDLINWPWKYRPLDAGKDTPSFYVHGAMPLNVEVTNAKSETDLDAQRILLGTRQYAVICDTLIVGASPLMDWRTFKQGFGATVAGLLGERPITYERDEAGDREFVDPAASLLWAPAHWGDHAGDISVWHSEMWFIHRPFGHYDGDAYCSADEKVIRDAWAQSGRTVAALGTPGSMGSHPH